MIEGKTPLFTQFAPAERAPEEEIREQARYFPGEGLLFQLLDAMPDVLLVLNQQRQIVFANRALFDWLGLPRAGQVRGLRPGEALGCIHAFESEGGCGTTEFCQFCGAVQSILSSLNGHESANEYHIVRRDGSALDLQVWATPLNVKGQAFSVLAIKDISDEKRRQALEHIFFHDILNTAGLLLGYAEILAETKSVEEIERIRKIFFQITMQLISEISAQRDLAAAERNELLVHPVPLHSLKLLRDAQAFYEGHELAKNRSLQIAPDAQVVEFASDETLLERVLRNMVKNALEACPSGQAVTLSCRLEGEWVSFAVHNPSFMPRDVQLQVFQRSFSTKGRGRGLGTYSMKLLSERYLQGRVTFTTSPEHGTWFKASYPLALPDEVS
jgi:signal transduction histidine kinase